MKSPQSSSRRIQVPDRVIDGVLLAGEVAQRLDGWVADRLGLGATRKVYDAEPRASHFRAGSWPVTVLVAAGTFVATDFLLAVARAPQQVHGHVRYLPVTHHPMVGAAVLAGVSALAAKFGPAIDRARQNRRMRMYRRFLEGGRYNARPLAIQQEREYGSRAERGRTEGFSR